MKEVNETATWVASMKYRMSILHILATDRLQGAEKTAYLIDRHLNREIFNSFIICAGNPLALFLRSYGCIVEILDVKNINPANMLRLSKIIRREKIDLLHASGYRASLFALLTSGLFIKRPVISHIHSADPRISGLNIIKLVEIATRNRFDLSIACSELVRTHYLNHNSFVMPDKIVSVSNGVEIVNRHPDLEAVNNLKEVLGIPADSFVFCYIGRMIKLKGIDVLLKAFQLIARVNHSSVLLLVGSGPMEIELKDMSVDLNLSPRVIFTGYRRDVEKILEIIDVFILPSWWEGLPNVLLEAMSHGKPVIASNVGGVKELVLHGHTGLLTPPGDVNRLAEHMNLMLNLTEMRGKMGESGFRHVQKYYDIKSKVRDIERLYLEVAGGGEEKFS